jgi:hypothetical protein
MAYRYRTVGEPIIPFFGSYIFRENPQCKHLDEKSL